MPDTRDSICRCTTIQERMDVTVDQVELVPPAERKVVEKTVFTTKKKCLVISHLHHSLMIYYFPKNIPVYCTANKVQKCFHVH